MSDSPEVPDDLGVLLELAFDAMPEMVFIKGSRSRLLWVNRAAREAYGMSNAELRDAIDAPHVDPDDTAQYVQDDHRVFSTGETLDIPVEQVTDTQGVSRPVHTIKSPMRYRGEIFGTVGVSRPIVTGDAYKEWLSEREERKERRHELTGFVQHVPAAVAMLDRSLHVLAVSDEWRALFDWQGSENDYEPYDHHHEPRLALSERLHESVRTGERQTLEQVPMAQGRIAKVHIAPWIIGESRGGTQAAGVLVKVSDETESIRAGEALVRLNDELTQFNYRVSHDLVAPLRTIRGLLELSEYALEDDDTEELTELHQRMGSQIDNLTTMVRDLMTLARADVQTGPEHVDLVELVEEVLESHAADSSACGAHIETEIQVESTRVERVRLRQVLDNLIGNAIKYRKPDSSPSISLMARANGAQLEVVVSDEGLGFAEEDAERIFEPFARAHSGLPGSGLGLAIARKHATRLGGQLKATREAGRSHFTLTLPLTQA